MNRIAHYEIADPEGHHHHLIDEVTGVVEPFEDPALERAIVAAARRAGIEMTGHEATDTIDKLSPASLDAVGETVVQLLREWGAVDAGMPAPRP
jgi:hypothetical protein